MSKPEIAPEKAYKKLLLIFEKIKNEEIEKDFLIEMLNYDNPCVNMTSATYLLKLDYEVDRALKKLDELVNTDFDTFEMRTLKINAKMTIKTYLEKSKYDIKQNYQS